MITGMYGPVTAEGMKIADLPERLAGQLEWDSKEEPDKAWAEWKINELKERQEAIEYKRARGYLPRPVVKDRPEWGGKVFDCQNWQGGWLWLAARGEEMQKPAACGKNYRIKCGPKRAKSRKISLREGVLRTPEWAEREYPFMTLTFRARETKGTKGNRVPETWGRWLQRMGRGLPGLAELIEQKEWLGAIEAIDEVLAENKPNSWTYEQVLMIHREWTKAMSELYEVPQYLCGVVLRGAFRQKHWIPFYNGCFYMLRKAWKRDFGEKMQFVRIMELTEQGVPHLHCCYQKPVEYDLWTIWRWLRHEWAGLLGELEHQVQVDAGQWQKSHSIEGSLDYKFKYLFKDYGASRQSKWFNKGVLELTEEEISDNWNEGYRRQSVSAEWPRAIAGDVDMFRFGTKQKAARFYSRRERFKAYGRMYRAINHPDTMKTEEQLEAELMEDETMKPMKLMWALMMWKERRRHIREWWCKWQKVVDWQKVNTEYKQVENWREEGWYWSEPYNEWWNQHFEVNGILYKGIA